MKKTTTKNVSITHESKKTVVIVDGKEIDIKGIKDNPDLLSLLNESNLGADLISEIMGTTVGSNENAGTQAISSNSVIKVECSSCNRTVSYAKGKCMYCGNPLQLLEKDTSNSIANEVDKKYLDTEQINTNDTATDNDLNYIDRLKDI